MGVCFARGSQLYANRLGAQMFRLFKKPRRPTEDDEWTFWSAEPTRRDLHLVRRWGIVYITKVSNHQFNVYRSGTAFVVTMHSRDGKEVERDGTGLFRGGKCASIADAWEAVVSYTSDILIASGMAGLPTQQAVLLDTTPDQDTFHLATMKYVDGLCERTQHFDPDTRQPLASPVPPSQIGELESSRHHNTKLLSKVLDAAVFRMESCLLMAEVICEFGVRNDDFEGAKTRYVVFTSWCARRSTIVLLDDHRDADMLLGIMDGLIQQQFEQFFAADRKAFDFAVEAFERFDQAFANEAEPGFSWWLGQAAGSFIFGANFEAIVPDGDNLEKWAKRFNLPSQVLIQIRADAKRILADLR